MAIIRHRQTKTDKAGPANRELCLTRSFLCEKKMQPPLFTCFRLITSELELLGRVTGGVCAPQSRLQGGTLFPLYC